MLCIKRIYWITLVVSWQNADADVDTSSNNLETSSQQPPTLELVPLLIDVSGYVRERSQCTQYLNFCYTVMKESKPFALKIFSRKS